ncbi:MAG: tetratricopeptide repeat protein [Myxococcota bacterium]|nr:tetratricopeptide repeat protein [Myxococcota bacterium]
MRFAVMGGLLGLVLLSLPAQALAQENLEEARATFEQAETEFERANYALALQGFQRSYELLEGHPRRPLVLYNIGRCYEELGRHREARDAYQRYLDEAGSEALEREDTEARIRELDTRVTMDASTPAEGGGDISPLGPVVMGVGGAMLVAGAVVGGLALASRGDLTAMCDSAMRCPADSRGLADEVSGLALATDVLLFGGAAIAAAGLVLTLVLQEDSERPAASVACAESGCVALVQGSF